MVLRVRVLRGHPTACTGASFVRSIRGIVCAFVTLVTFASLSPPALATSGGRGDALTTQQVVALAKLPDAVHIDKGTVMGTRKFGGSGFEWMVTQWSRDPKAVGATALPQAVGFVALADATAAQNSINGFTPLGKAERTAGPNGSTLITSRDQNTGLIFVLALSGSGNYVTYAQCQQIDKKVSKSAIKKSATACALKMLAAQTRKLV